MMHELVLDLELADEIVVSRTSATAGQHRCLPFIPGATLLGALASHMYDANDPRMYDLFHAGRVRFGDARPLTAGDRGTWPVPLAWHSDKGGDSPQNGGRWDPRAIASLVAVGLKDSAFQQAQQIREGFVGETDAHVRPRTRYRMKTAIDRATGSAAESQLFGYEALARGQRFRARITADDAGLLETLHAQLGSVLHLGRSRSAQYGRARILSATQPAPAASPCLPLAELDGVCHLVLWLASDLAVRDVRTGMPTYTPSLADLGLADLLSGGAAVDKTFVRPRRYRPYNARRGSHDLERQVIGAGSVLCYRLDRRPDPVAEAQLGARLAASLGEHREAGLGEIVLAPALTRLLLQRNPEFVAAAAAIPAQPSVRPDHPLVAWLTAGEQRDKGEFEANAWAEKTLAALRGTYASARRYNGIAADLACGPGASQWGRVQETAVSKPDREPLLAALFEGDSAVCKKGDEDWGTASGKPDETFRTWLDAAVKNAYEKGVGARGIIRLAALTRADAPWNRTHNEGDAA